MRFLKVISTNLFVLAIIVFLLLTGVAVVLKSVTRHGEALTVPDITGMNIDQAAALLQSKNLRFVITDSLYFDDKPKLSVLEQNPEPQAKVKEGRIVYITLNSNAAPLVALPNLMDVSLRQAQVILQSVGLKTGQLIYRPDIAQNVVLNQLYGNKTIQAGTKVPKGATIDLILGNGLSDSANVAIPNLIGLTLSDANNLLTSSTLNLGAAVFQGPILDSASAVVFRQNPAYQMEGVLKPGQTVDIYLRQE